MIVNMHGTGLDLTPAIKEYTEKKVNSLSKFFSNITQADIDLGLTTNHHNKGEIYYAEFNLHVPGGVVRVTKEEKELYKAIDKVKDHLKVELEKIKEKMRSKDKTKIRKQKEYQD